MNSETRRRLDVALLKDSETMQSLQRDARMHHMEDQLGKMAAIRLSDYYRIAEKLGTYSVEGILAALALLRGSVSAPEQVLEQVPEVVSKTEEEEQAIICAEYAEENANEAADIWGSM